MNDSADSRDHMTLMTSEKTHVTRRSGPRAAGEAGRPPGRASAANQSNDQTSRFVQNDRVSILNLSNPE